MELVLPKFRKDVLKAGQYSVPSRDGKSRRLLVYTGDDVRHLAKRFEEMKSAGLFVPACWEHQDDAKPDRAERLANRARFNFGFAEAAVAEDGGTLAFDLDVPLDDDAKRLPSVRYVSPEIVTDWVDGSGRLWPGKSITHIAATSRPVQHQQQPFERLSLADTDNTVRLSLADRLGDEPMADEPDFGGKKDNAPVVAEKKYDAKEAIGKLQGYGIHLPDDTDESNFFERLCVALHALDNAAGGDKDLDDMTDVPEPEAPAEEPKPVPGSPVMMSMERQTALERRNALLEERATSLEKGLLKARAIALHRAGTITKPIRDSLVSELGTERLSLGDDGKLSASKVLTKIEAYEALGPGASSAVLLSTDRDAKPQPVANPEEVATRTEQEEVANRLSRGRYAANKQTQKN